MLLPQQHAQSVKRVIPAFCHLSLTTVIQSISPICNKDSHYSLEGSQRMNALGQYAMQASNLCYWQTTMPGSNWEKIHCSQMLDPWSLEQPRRISNPGGTRSLKSAEALEVSLVPDPCWHSRSGTCLYHKNAPALRTGGQSLLRVSAIAMSHAWDWSKVCHVSWHQSHSQYCTAGGLHEFRLCLLPTYSIHL